MFLPLCCFLSLLFLIGRVSGDACLGTQDLMFLVEKSIDVTPGDISDIKDFLKSIVAGLSFSTASRNTLFGLMQFSGSNQGDNTYCADNIHPDVFDSYYFGLSASLFDSNGVPQINIAGAEEGFVVGHGIEKAVTDLKNDGRAHALKKIVVIAKTGAPSCDARQTDPPADSYLATVANNARNTDGIMLIYVDYGAGGGTDGSAMDRYYSKHTNGQDAVIRRPSSTGLLNVDVIAALHDMLCTQFETPSCQYLPDSQRMLVSIQGKGMFESWGDSYCRISSGGESKEYEAQILASGTRFECKIPQNSRVWQWDIQSTEFHFTINSRATWIEDQLTALMPDNCRPPPASATSNTVGYWEEMYGGGSTLLFVFLAVLILPCVCCVIVCIVSCVRIAKEERQKKVSADFSLREDTETDKDK